MAGRNKWRPPGRPVVAAATGIGSRNSNGSPQIRARIMVDSSVRQRFAEDRGIRITAYGVPVGIADRSRFYFVHSYYPSPTEKSLVAATCDYGAPFTCAVARDNIFAVQFHPEKSQSAGLQLLSNFVRWRP